MLRLRIYRKCHDVALGNPRRLSLVLTEFEPAQFFVTVDGSVILVSARLGNKIQKKLALSAENVASSKHGKM